MTLDCLPPFFFYGTVVITDGHDLSMTATLTAGKVCVNKTVSKDASWRHWLSYTRGSFAVKAKTLIFVTAKTIIIVEAKTAIIIRRRRRPYIRLHEESLLKAQKHHEQYSIRACLLLTLLPCKYDHSKSCLE